MRQPSTVFVWDYNLPKETSILSADTGLEAKFTDFMEMTVSHTGCYVIIGFQEETSSHRLPRNTAVCVEAILDQARSRRR